MSKELAKAKQAELAQLAPTWSPEQRELIKRTVAPGASDDELAMFLHIASVSGLDPLRKQIHFTKMGGRVAFIADINGLQARAAKESDFEGILHAVVFEKDDFQVNNATGEIARHLSNPLGTAGKCIGAWAVVKRKGKLPFVSVVRFEEYFNSNNPLWKTKPAVMIDKVAKSTALRLAYPEQLGGIYEAAELDKAPEIDVTPPSQPVASRTQDVKGQVRATLDKQLAARAGKMPPIVEVADGQTEEDALKQAKRSPWERIVALGRRHGVEGADLNAIIKEVTSKKSSGALTDADVGLVQGVLESTASPSTVGEPPDDFAPPPSDEDGPH